MADKKQYTADDIRLVKAPDSIPSMIEWFLRCPKLYFLSPQEFEAGLYAAMSCYCMSKKEKVPLGNFHSIWHEVRAKYSDKPPRAARMSDSGSWDETRDALREIWDKLCPALNQLAEQAE